MTHPYKDSSQIRQSQVVNKTTDIWVPLFQKAMMKNTFFRDVTHFNIKIICIEVSNIHEKLMKNQCMLTSFDKVYPERDSYFVGLPERYHNQFTIKPKHTFVLILRLQL